MNRVKRANGFHGERPADSREHVICHGDDVAATFKATQCQHRRTLLLGRQSSARTRPKDGPTSFCQRQRRCKPSPFGPDGAPRICVPLEKRGDQCAGLDVSSPRRTRLRRGVRRCRGPGAWSMATLRHGQRRSVQQRFRQGARYQANPPLGRPLRAVAESRQRQRVRRIGSACLLLPLCPAGPVPRPRDHEP